MQRSKQRHDRSQPQHSEECRRRLAEELEKVGDERLVREKERLFEYLEEEENKKKRARVSEGDGDSKSSASSSGPAPAEEQVPRCADGNRLRRQ